MQPEIFNMCMTEHNTLYMYVYQSKRQSHNYKNSLVLLPNSPAQKSDLVWFL